MATAGAARAFSISPTFDQCSPSGSKAQALENDWLTLLAEVRASRDLDPASPEAQALVTRWDQLYERTAGYYREYPELWQAIGKNYEAGVYANQEGAPQADDFAFIELLAERDVFCLPGTVVEQPGYFRISLTASDEMIERGLAGFAAARERALGAAG